MSHHSNDLPKDEIRRMFNDKMNFAYDCKTMNTTCGQKCGGGICKSQIIDVKRICRAICQEVIITLCSHEINAPMTEIDHWKEMEKELEKI